MATTFMLDNYITIDDMLQLKENLQILKNQINKQRKQTLWKCNYKKYNKRSK